MMKMTEVEAQEFLKGLEDKFANDTEFLIQRGWTKTEKKELGGEKVFSVWVSPDGEEYGHQCSLVGSNNWRQAIDRAEYDLVKECGFETFTVSSYCPEHDLEFNQRHAKNASGWDGWVYFIHPTSRKVYSYLEAVDIARFNGMQDLSQEFVCQKTKEIQQILDGQKIEPREGMTLLVHFVLEDREHHFYRFYGVE